MALQTSQNSCDPSLYFISFLCLKSKTGLPLEEVNISLKIEAYVVEESLDVMLCCFP